MVEGLGLNPYSRPAHLENGLLAPRERWEVMPEHLGAVAALAKAFGDKIGLGDICEVAGGGHDTGKFDLQMLGRFLGRVESFDHPALGAALLDAATEGILTQPILGHHRYIPDETEEDASECVSARLEKAATHRHSIELIPFLDRAAEAARTAKSVLKAALRSEFPNAADQERFFPMFFFAMQKFINSALVDADCLSAERFHKGHGRRNRFPPMSVLLDRLVRFQARVAAAGAATAEPWLVEMRNDVWASAISAARLEASLYFLTAPTGSAKTLAYVVLAMMKAVSLGLDRVIIVLPYCAVTSQVSDVLRAAIGRGNVIEHHTGYDPKERVKSFRSYRQILANTPRNTSALHKESSSLQEEMRQTFENWDAPVIVTTREQFDESFFCRLPGRSRKVHNMARSAIVFDEIQAGNRDLTIPFVGMLHVLRSLYRSVVICSTATQPSYHKSDDRQWGLEGGVDVVARHREYFAIASRRTSMTRIGRKSSREVAEMVAEHRQVMCVLNTRLNAVLVSTQLERMGVPHILLYSLRCKRERNRVVRLVARCLAAGIPIRLVTTQAVEAGTDFDFPVGYSEDAPLDSLDQRRGRVNRHGRRGTSQFYVFTLCDGNSNPSYVAGLASTETVLSSTGDFNVVDVGTMDAYYARMLRSEKPLDKHRIVPDRHMSMSGRGGLFRSKSKYPPTAGANVYRTRFASYDEFKYIGGKCSVVIPTNAECRRAIADMDAAMASGKKPARKTLATLSGYVVSIYENELDDLARKTILENHNGFFVLRDVAGFYNAKRGLLIAGMDGVD
jgi:CRISPR-associated helicase Cas3/CRISPR-associated endonuclease Cas3-HD